MNQKQIVIEGKAENEVTAETGRVTPSGRGPLAKASSAALYRCQDCGVWWGSSRQYSAQDRQALRLAEPHTDQFLWVDYRGWRNGAEPDICPECGR